MRAIWLGAGLALLLGATTVHAAADLSKVNGDISVAAGQQAGNLDTVNGDIHVGADATAGKASTVNGDIVLGAGAHAGALSTVNGAIRLEAGASSSGIGNVNGSLHLAPRSTVAGNAGNVNGEITLDAATVGGNLQTTAGDITLSNGAVIHGSLTVKRDNSWLGSWFPRLQHWPVIVIGPGCRVDGPLLFQRPVKLYVSDQASVGPIQGAKPVRYTGAAPPTGD